MRPILVLAALTLLIPACRCSEKKPPARTDAQAVEDFDAQPEGPPVTMDPVPREVSFATPTAAGVARFSAPRGEQVLSMSTSRDGELLAAVSASTLFLFDGTLRRGRAIDLPGVMPRAWAVAVAKDRVAVVREAPTEPPETRLYVMDALSGKTIQTHTIPGKPIAAAPMDEHVFALLVDSPSTIYVFKADTGKEFGKWPGPVGPRRIDVHADGRRAGLAFEKNAILLNLIDGAEIVGLDFGPHLITPDAVFPVGTEDAFVVGTHNGQAVAVATGTNRDTSALPVGQGKLLGGATDEAGERGAVFVNLEADGKTLRTFVFDTGTWKTVGSIAAAPTNPHVRGTAVGRRVLVPQCNGALSLDLAGMKSKVQAKFPAAVTGDCLHGLWRIGDRVAAHREGHIFTWPLGATQLEETDAYLPDASSAPDASGAPDSGNSDGR